MASPPRKAWKLQEFMAHTADVKCLGLGHKSGRVMVTGGDDRKVNLWSVEKPNCIMSLTGHTTSVESVEFDCNEEFVVAGSLSGALKVWNLEEAKILRTLTGHKSGIKSLDFHPYGNYVASGSMDCNVKLWDIRRKGCIYTYKNHTGCVNCLKFTPDGLWIASGSEDNTIKIWDLTAGKLLQELKLHKGAVNTVEFHPSDLLLASGSNDRTVKFWDLETFQEVSTSDTDKCPTKSVAFHPDGTCLYSASGDTLKVYGWEPLVCHDVVPVAWSDVADMSITNSQLIAASFSKSQVSTFVVDLQKVAPTGAISKSDAIRSTLSSSNSRRSFHTERPPTSTTRSEPKRSETPPDKQDQAGDEVSVSRAEIQNQDDYNKLFRGHAGNANVRNRLEPFKPPPDDTSIDKQTPQSQPPKTTAPVKKETSPAPASRVPGQDSIKAEDFLQKEKASSKLSESETLEALKRGHGTMLQVLHQRSRNLQVVRAMWTSGNTKAAIDSAITMKNIGVMVDLLNIINTRGSVWNLDLCNLLLPQLRDIMNSKHESHVLTAANSVKLVLRNFGQVIKSNIEQPPNSFVDISREERYRKCKSCHDILVVIKSTISSSLHSTTPKLASAYKEIMLLMGTLE